MREYLRTPGLGMRLVNPRYIQSERGVGYRMPKPTAAQAL